MRFCPCRESVDILFVLDISTTERTAGVSTTGAVSGTDTTTGETVVSASNPGQVFLPQIVNSPPRDLGSLHCSVSSH